MSDYLSNLAAKTLRLTDVIQPRLGSLFEPPSVPGEPLFGHFPAREEMASDGRPAGAMTFAGPLMPASPGGNTALARALMQGIPQPPDIMGIQPPDLQQQQLETGAEQSMAEHSRPSVSSQPAPRLVPPSLDVQSAPLSSPALPTPVQTPFTLTPAAVGTPAAGRSAQEFVPGTTERQADAARSGETAAPAPHSALAAHVQPPPEEHSAGRTASLGQNPSYLEVMSHRARGPVPTATVVVQQHDLPRLEPAVPPPTAPLTTQAPESTIKITIGRVDVRAIMPASPAPRPAPARPSPSLSLEDYLKRREGRRR